MFHPKRRPNASDDSISQFKQRCKYVFFNSENRQIVNSDESFFRCNETFNKTWDKTGSKNVYVNSDSNEKEGFTLLATICLDGTKFSLELLLKGTTQRCERSWFGDHHHIGDNQSNVEEVDNPFGS